MDIKDDHLRRGVLSRRQFLTGVGGLMVLGAGTSAGGCGSGSTANNQSNSSGDVRSVNHKYGTTELEGRPQRVVSVGYSDHDFLYALGVKPVAARFWYDDDVINPWAEDAAGDADPEVLNMPEGINFEAIAALSPDLIVGIYSGMTAEDYETLSQIAPTVTQTDEYIDYGTPWQETMQLTGQAVNRAGRAEELVTNLEDRFLSVREEYPEFEGKSLTIATYSEGKFSVFASEDPRSRFFRLLGFEIPEQIDELTGDSFYAELSAERVDLLDSDILVWDQLSFTEGGRRTIENQPLIRRLDVMKFDRAIYMEDELELAFAWQTILSIPFALDGTVPMLAATED